MYSNMAENGGKGQGEPVQGALDILCVAEGGDPCRSGRIRGAPISSADKAKRIRNNLKLRASSFKFQVLGQVCMYMALLYVVDHHRQKRQRNRRIVGGDK
jgi:hypothetical protein